MFSTGIDIVLADKHCREGFLYRCRRRIIWRWTLGEILDLEMLKPTNDTSRFQQRDQDSLSS
jgi:hypothetical protein